MLKHSFEVIFTCFYYFSLLYFLFCELSYLYFKHIKSDARFENIGFFKYLNSPVKILKGD